MFNITTPLEVTCSTGCIAIDYCKEKCMYELSQVSYEFVWLFVLGFIFMEMPSLLYLISLKTKELSTDNVTKLSKGLKIAGYTLNLAGILWFLFIAL